MNKRVEKPVDVEKLIQKAVQEGIAAGKKVRKRELSAYQQTEKKLYTYNDVKKYIKDCKEELEEIEEYGLRDKSKGIVFMPSGCRISSEDMLEARIMDLRYKIQTNEREIKRIDAALEAISSDEYYEIIELKYLNVKRLNDDEIAAEIFCDRTTVCRNRNRLVSSISARLYGFD